MLGYIKNETTRFHMFVSNRVQQIKDLTDVNQWRYIDTKSNPTDLTSRGATADEIKENTKWWKGPDFLSRQPLPPDRKSDCTELSLDDKEVKRTVVLATNTELISANEGLNERLRYCSCWQRARRAAAVCLRLKQRLITRQAKTITDHNQPMRQYQPVNVEEILTAETEILKDVQETTFAKEQQILQNLTSDNVCSRQRKLKNSALLRLDPFLCQDCLIRVRGRIRRANIPHELAHPVILPKHCYVTTLVIRYFHLKTCHSGTNTTLNEIRACGYWIMKGELPLHHTFGSVLDAGNYVEAQPVR